MTAADKPAFVQAYTRLAVAVRERDPDPVQMQVLFEELLPFEIEFVVTAAARLAPGDWFPKLGEWRAMIVQIDRERLAAQRELLRKRTSPLCDACDDTGWQPDADGCVRKCACVDLRRLERLGRRPWPALPVGVDPPPDLARVAAMDAKVATLAGRKGMRPLSVVERAAVTEPDDVVQH
jgi:hypothetical protein